LVPSQGWFGSYSIGNSRRILKEIAGCRPGIESPRLMAQYSKSPKSDEGVLQLPVVFNQGLKEVGFIEGCLPPGRRRTRRFAYRAGL
jgi:hypothetical protein